MDSDFPRALRLGLGLVFLCLTPRDLLLSHSDSDSDEFSSVFYPARPSESAFSHFPSTHRLGVAVTVRRAMGTMGWRRERGNGEPCSMALRVVEKDGVAGGDLGYARKMSRERRPAPEAKGSGRESGGWRRVDDLARKKRRLCALGFVVVAGGSTAATEIEEGEVVEELDDEVEEGELVQELELDGWRPGVSSIAAAASSRHPLCWGAGEGEVEIERRLEATLGRFRKRVQAGPIGAGKLGALFGGYGTFLLPPSERKGGSLHVGGTQRQREAQPPAQPPGSGHGILQASSDDPLRAALAAARLVLQRRQKRDSPEERPRPRPRPRSRPPASSKGGALLLNPAVAGAPPRVHGSPFYTGGRGDGGLERRLEAVFGDCRRRFEVGQVNAGNLGAMFGGYGTFLLAARGDGGLERRLEAVFGDCRRRFEVGQVNAGNLGAMFGGYGSFLLAA